MSASSSASEKDIESRRSPASSDSLGPESPEDPDLQDLIVDPTTESGLNISMLQELIHVLQVRMKKRQSVRRCKRRQRNALQPEKLPLVLTGHSSVEHQQDERRLLVLHQVLATKSCEGIQWKEMTGFRTMLEAYDAQLEIHRSRERDRRKAKKLNQSIAELQQKLRELEVYYGGLMETKLTQSQQALCSRLKIANEFTKCFDFTQNMPEERIGHIITDHFSPVVQITSNALPKIPPTKLDKSKFMSIISDSFVGCHGMKKSNRRVSAPAGESIVRYEDTTTVCFSRSLIEYSMPLLIHDEHLLQKIIGRSIDIDYRATMFFSKSNQLLQILGELDIACAFSQLDLSPSEISKIDHILSPNA